ncbi:MAG: hypothetical protein ACI80L_000611 [Pseudohongiellaceae bacterium]|jgi:hypothetical protein
MKSVTVDHYLLSSKSTKIGVVALLLTLLQERLQLGRTQLTQ